MITTPNRLSAIAEKIERGEAVDLQKVATLQAIDLVCAGRQFVEEAIRFNEEAHEDVERIIAAS